MAKATSLTATIRRPLRGGVDRNAMIASCTSTKSSRPLRGGVDRNSVTLTRHSDLPSRPLRGGVDRNDDLTADELRDVQVAPFAGVWIETHLPYLENQIVAVAPSRGCGSKLGLGRDQPGDTRVAPFAGVWIETPRRYWPCCCRGSPPSRGCGSKQFKAERLALPVRRPLRGGVDRNTVGSR